MEIKYGDIVLDNGNVSFKNGDIVFGEGKEQQIGAIVQAVAGNFRQHPTLAANVVHNLDGVANGSSIGANIIRAGKIDGWRVDEMDIDAQGDDVAISIVKADKITNNTNSLI